MKTINKTISPIARAANAGRTYGTLHLPEWSDAGKSAVKFSDIKHGNLADQPFWKRSETTKTLLKTPQ